MQRSLHGLFAGLAVIQACTIQMELGPQRHRVGAGANLGLSDLRLLPESPPEPELERGSARGGYLEVVLEDGETMTLLRLVAERGEYENEGFAEDATLEQYLVWGAWSPVRWGGAVVGLRPTFGVAFGGAKTSFDTPFLPHDWAAVGGIHMGLECTFVDHLVLNGSMYLFTGGEPGDTELEVGEVQVSLGVRF